jgi:putative addiction module component (TIGR02574 family)
MAATPVSDVSEKALALPLTARAALLDRLFDSIDSELDGAETQSKWAAEAEKRIDAFEGGQLKAADGTAALKELRRSILK